MAKESNSASPSSSARSSSAPRETLNIASVRETVSGKTLRARAVESSKGGISAVKKSLSLTGKRRVTACPPAMADTLSPP